MKVRILLDNIIYSKVNNGGVSNYWFEITRYLLQQNLDLISFFDFNNADNFHRKHLHIPADKCITSKKEGSFLNRALPIYFATDEKFIYHSSYYRPLIGSKNKIEITTVHDFTHDYFFPYFQKKIHNQIKYSAIQRSKGIICVSNSTYADLMKFCPVKKNQKVAVIHNGVSDRYFKIHTIGHAEAAFIQTHQLDCDYLLYVGSRASYKNFKFTLNLLKETDNFHLIVVGLPFSEQELKWILQLGLNGRIQLLSNVQDAELNILYNFAKAFVYPSSYEGFGIPIIEAMKAGCPVLGLKNSSIVEVAQEAALLFDKPLVSEFKKGLELLLKNKDFKQQILEKGFSQSKNFSWEKCARETREFYEENYL